MSMTAMPVRPHPARSRPRFLRAAIAAAAALATAVPALAQRTTVLEQVDGSDWTLRIALTVRADGWIDPETKMPVREPLKVDSAAIVFPIPRDSASHLAWSNISGELKVDGRTVTEQFQQLTGYHSGVTLGKWALLNWQGEGVSLNIDFPVTAYNTKFDEARANQLDWPAPWPAPAQSTFEPQLYIDMGPEGPYDMEPIKALVKKWSRGQDPKSVRPTILAKYFASEVWGMVQPTGNGLVYNRQSELEGMDLQGAPQTALRGRGTEFDIVCLLTAVYREAGLPARTVIGYDVGARKRDGNAFLGKTGSGKLRAWVEFALMDNGQLVWVPVDVVRMRQSSSRPPSDLGRTWRWFGTHDELEGIIPFAFQFHPPTTVVAHGSPAFWGWMVSPRPPDRVLQGIRFDAITTPQRANDPNRPGTNRAPGRR